MPRSRGSTVSRNISTVRRSLRTLERALASLALGLKVEATRQVKASGKPSRKLKLSPARRKALKLHGTYMGYVRQLKPRAKAEVRALREKKGVKVAIARARWLAAK
jgi:hypothetical protein